MYYLNKLFYFFYDINIKSIYNMHTIPNEISMTISAKNIFLSVLFSYNVYKQQWYL